MNGLDWGSITPDSVNLGKNRFTYIFNHQISTPTEVDRTIRFVVGRITFCERHLPANPTHDIKIDSRGQNVDDTIVEHISRSIREMYGKPNLGEISIIRYIL